MNPYRWHLVSLFAAATLVVLVFFWLSTLQPPEETANEGMDSTNEQTEPEVTFVDPTRGNADARLTLVIFGDYACQACATTSENLETVRRNRPNDFRIVWKDLPNSGFHPIALEAALAARCAGDQGRFWEFHDALLPFSNQLSSEFFLATATRLNLDVSAWSTCVADQTHLPIIEKTAEEATALDITATPAIFIGSDRLEGQLSVERIEAFLAEHLSTNPL